MGFVYEFQKAEELYWMMWASWGITASKGGFLSISLETGELRSTEVPLDVARHSMTTLGTSICHSRTGGVAR